MDELEQENALLEQRIAALEGQLATPVTQPSGGSLRDALAVGTGGLINLGDILTFGQLSKGIAAAPAIARDIYGYATGAPAQDYYTEELAKVNALKNLYSQEREKAGLTGLETALSFMAPVPSGKAQALTSLAPAAKEAGLGLAAYLGSEAGQAILPENEYAGLIGSAGTLTGIGGVAKLAEKLGPGLEEGGKGLLRTALGARQSDYTKTARNQIVETIPGNFESQVKKSLDKIVEEKTLGDSVNPEVLYSNLQQGKETLEASIQEALQKVDAERTYGIVPRLDKTLEWINTKAPADKVNFYKDKVNTFLSGLKEQGRGSLVYLNQQKKAIGENWKVSPETDPTFWRKFYGDVKDNIEKYAPEVKQLNKQKQDLLVVEPIIERGKRQAEQVTTPQKLTRALLYTTGGLGVPAATAAVGGNIPLGLAIAGGLGLLGTKPGQKLLGQTLSGTGKALSEAGPTSGTVLREILRSARGAQLQSEIPQQGFLPETSVMSPIDLDSENSALEERIKALEAELQPATTTKVGKQNISIPSGEQYAPADLVKAVIKVESAGKPDAVSGKGARGLMQLMPGTAKELGVDPSDPTENVEGGSRYLQQQIDKFGSRELALAAYNWGPANVQRAIDKIKADGKKPTWELVKQYVKVPKETRNYVDRVLSFI